MIAPLFNVHSDMGTLFGLKAFAVAILGGMASAWGVMLAGLMFGVTESLITGVARLGVYADPDVRAGDRGARVDAERAVRAGRGEEGMKLLAWMLFAAGFGAALAFTAVANSYYVFIMATLALTAIAGIGLNVLLGLTGQISFGHVGFYALGAYAVAILTVAAKWNFWAALPVAALVAGVTGALLALPALRGQGTVSGDGHDRVRLHRRARRRRVARPHRRAERDHGHPAALGLRVRVRRARRGARGHRAGGGDLRVLAACRAAAGEARCAR